MDIVPSKLLDNIVTSKTFTPDEPGNFSGGLVSINTKPFPDQFYVDVSAALSYNSLSTSNDNFLTYSGSGTDWRGLDDGSRAMPPAVQDRSCYDSGSLPAPRNCDQALNWMIFPSHLIGMGATHRLGPGESELFCLFG